MPEKPLSPSEKRKAQRQRDIEEALSSDPTKQITGPISSIGELNVEIARRLRDEFALGVVDANMPFILAAHGEQFNAASSLNVAAGSQLMNTSLMTGLLQKAVSMAGVDRESMLTFGPIAVDVSESLTKSNKVITEARVKVAMANSGVKAVQNKMFVPPPSFAPGEQIAVEVSEKSVA